MATKKKKKKPKGAWDSGSKGEGVSGCRGLGNEAVAAGVRWLCGPRAECQAERHLGGLAVGVRGSEGHGVDGPEGEGGGARWRIS